MRGGEGIGLKRTWDHIWTIGARAPEQSIPIPRGLGYEFPLYNPRH